MKAKVNKVTIRLDQIDPYSLTAAALAVQTDSNLSVAPELTARAGDSIWRECVRIGWCAVGEAVITSAGNLPFEKLIHVVGPRWGEGSERGKLANATLVCLRLAEEHQLKSIALPAISTGTLGYPLENCAKTMLTEIIDYTFEDLKRLRSVTLYLTSNVTYTAFQQEFQRQIQDLQQSGQGKIKA